MAETEAPAASLQGLAARERPGAPCVLVVFGAAGDLTQRLLIPALYNLAHHNLLPKDFAIVGLARNQMTDQDFRQAMRSAIDQSARVGSVEPAIWENI
jgi:glucose-6-phosphate 1-dehydrogenase